MNSYIKSFLAISLAILLIIGATMTTFGSSEPPYLKGDVNGDGGVNALDASLILQHDAKLIKLAEDSLARADVNGDGKVDALDASLILQYDAKLINAFPGEPPVSPGAPPYPYIHVNTMNEIVEFVNGTNPEKYRDTDSTIVGVYGEKRYEKMIAIVQKFGFLIEPYYKGKSMQSYSDEYEFTLLFTLEGIEGAAGGYSFPLSPITQKITGLQIGSAFIHYLSAEQASKAKDAPWMYIFGRENQETLEGYQSLGINWVKEKMNVGEEEVEIYCNETSLGTSTELVFLYEENILVSISIPENEQGFKPLDFVKDLSFVKISLKG